MIVVAGAPSYGVHFRGGVPSCIFPVDCQQAEMVYLFPYTIMLSLQMVIPPLTENYGATRDPPEKTAPMCTLHSFPHNIDHCLTWARSEFEGQLESQPKGALP